MNPSNSDHSVATQAMEPTDEESHIPGTAPPYWSDTSSVDEWADMTIDVSQVPAALLWLHPGVNFESAYRSVPNLHLNLRFDGQAGNALFRLEAKLRISSSSRPVHLFVFIPPERIQGILRLDTPLHGSPVKGAVYLRFSLSKPPICIGPPKPISFQDLSIQNYGRHDNLRSLGSDATSFDICLPGFNKDHPLFGQVQHLCAAFHPRNERKFSSTKHQVGVDSLYGGRGGTVLSGDWDLLGTDTGDGGNEGSEQGDKDQGKGKAGCRAERRAAARTRMVLPPNYNDTTLDPPPPSSFSSSPAPIQEAELATNKSIFATKNKRRRIEDEQRTQCATQPATEVMFNGFEQISDQLRHQIRDLVRDQVRDQSRDDMRDQIRDQLRAEQSQQLHKLKDELLAEMGRMLSAELNGEYREKLKTELLDELRRSTATSIRHTSNAIRQDLKSEMDSWPEEFVKRDELEDRAEAVLDNALQSTRQNLENSLRKQVKDALDAASKALG